MIQSRYLGGSLLLCGLVGIIGCGESADYTSGICGSGEEVQINADTLCVYTITETGFLCPSERPFPYSSDAATVCADRDDVEDEVVAKAIAQVTDTMMAQTSNGTTSTSNGTTAPTSNGTTTAPTTNKVDILWVVDNSGSMCEEQADLRLNFSQFADVLVAAGIDFQLTVITTDMEDPAESGRFQNFPDDTPGSQCNIVVDISACPTENGEDPPPLIIHSEDPRYQTEGGIPDVAKIKTDFGCNATTGITGNGFEMGLEAARTALSPALAQGFNAGFLRDDAMLAVVFLTDENDCSDGGALNLTNGNICEWERDQLIPVQEYIDFFAGLKTDSEGNPDPNKVIMSGILAPTNNINYEYGEEVEPSCVVQDDGGNVIGRGYDGYRYKEVIDAFPYNHNENICDDTNFKTSLGSIGSTIVGALEQ